MRRKQSKTSASRRPSRPNVAYVPDSELDFSDIPEMTDEEFNRARRIGSPRKDHGKDLIAIWVAPRVLNRLKRQAAKRNRPFQIYISEILERAANQSAA